MIYELFALLVTIGILFALFSVAAILRAVWLILLGRKFDDWI